MFLFFYFPFVFHPSLSWHLQPGVSSSLFTQPLRSSLEPLFPPPTSLFRKFSFSTVFFFQPRVLFQVHRLSLPSTQRNSRLKKLQGNPKLYAMPTTLFSFFSFVYPWLFWGQHSSDPLSDSRFLIILAVWSLAVLPSFSSYCKTPSLGLPCGSFTHP